MTVDISKMKLYENEMVETRRDLHMHPEIGFALHRTRDMVLNRLNAYGCFDIHEVAETGLVAVFNSGRKGRTIAIRADMDALPMDDMIDKPYRSVYMGAAHKCGHDAHTAMLLGAAHYIADNQDEFSGVIKLVFQPSEEQNPSSGAVEVLKSGVLDDVDMMFGQHVEPMYPAGQVAVRYGGIYAGATMFDLTIKGVSGHGATPQLTRDPILTAAQIINDTQMIITRRTDPTEPAVITVGSVHSGNAPNVIPAEAHIKGTTRAMDRQVFERNRELFDRTVRDICDMNECSYELSHEVVMPVLNNDHDATAILEEAAVRMLGRDDVIVRHFADASGEDFAFYSEKIPCSFMMLGCSNDVCHEGLHSPMFDLDESVMPIGAAILLAAAGEAARRP